MIAGLLWLATRTAQVSIPLGTYSFPELAERLSIPEMKVTVDGSLRERGALVGIKELPTSQALKLLCGGLELKETSKGDRQIVLIQDPAVADREKRWRNGLLTILNEKWTTQLSEFSELAKLDNAGLNARLKEIQKNGLNTDGWDSLSITFLFQGQPFTLAAPLFEQSAPPMSIDLLTNHVQDDQVFAQLPPELEKSVRQATAVKELHDPVILRRTFVRQPGEIRVAFSIFGTGAQGKPIDLSPPGNWILVGARPYSSPRRVLFTQLAMGDASNHLPAMSSDSGDWLRRSAKATLEAIQLPNVDDPVPVKEYEGALSNVVESWAKKSGQDVVMELAPIAELLDLDRGYTATATINRSLRECIARDDSWGLEVVDGALVVRNRMGFVDHTSDCPIGSIAHYLRTTPGRYTQSTLNVLQPEKAHLDDIDIGPGLPLIDDVLPLIRMRLDPSFSPNPWVSWRGYHGLTEYYLHSSCALLWQGLPSETIATVRRENAGTLRVATTDISQQALEEVAASLEAPDATRPALLNVENLLSNDQLAVRWLHLQNGEIVVLLSLDSGLGLAAFHVKA